MISAERMSDLFVEVADTLVDEFDVVDFLHNLTVHAVTIGGAKAAGLMLTDQMGRLQFMAASHPGSESLELFQLQNSEGPCLDCFTTGSPIVNADLSQAANRWPTFAPRALELGYGSVHAFPKRLRDNVIGALNLFGSSHTLFEESDVRLVQADGMLHGFLNLSASLGPVDDVLDLVARTVAAVPALHTRGQETP